MKKKVFSLMMTLLLAFMGVARADELTVNDGSTTNGFVPVYGFYADAYNKCEFVQPAADLADMAGGTINGMTFYASQSSVSWGTANFQVFLTEVGSTSISAFNGPGTVVYEGALSISDGMMTVNFTTPYTYNGGNLLFGFYQTSTGSYVTSTWYGVSATGASGSGYDYSSLSGCTFGQKNFLPKMTFDYTPAGGGGEGGEEIVVEIGDGTETTFVTPYNSLWCLSFVEQLYTAEEIGTAGTITAISFNLRQTDAAQDTEIEVFMKNVSRSAFEGTSTSVTSWEDVTASDMVFSGSFTFNPGWSTITLDTPFQYDGTSNLMIGIHESTASYNTRYFYYTSATNMVASFHNDTYNPDPYNLASFSGYEYVKSERANIQIAITTAGGGDTPDYQRGLHTFAYYGVADEAEPVIDTLYIERPNGAWMEPYHFQLYNDGTEDVDVVLIDFLHNNGYFSMAEGTEYPFTVAHNGMDGAVDLYINTNTEWDDTEEINSLLTVNTDERSTHLYQIVAAPYEPYCPDVVETAFILNDGNALTDGFTWREFMSEIWDGPANEYELHANYDLPDYEDSIPDGYDAVLKFTVSKAMMLNARVKEGYENGKVALYTEDFGGEAGPMANNNYTERPFNGGGITPGGSGELTVHDGDPQTTNYYVPVYGLWMDDYTRSEMIYPAAELSDMTGTNINSMKFYTNNFTYSGWGEATVSIYMKEVSENTLTAYIGNANATTVYSGSLTVTDNEMTINFTTPYHYNGGNLLVGLMQNTEGTYHSCYFYGQTITGASGYGYNSSSAANATFTQNNFLPKTTFAYGNGRSNRDVILAESFENGMPTGWTVEGDGTWTVGTGDYYSSTGAHTGSYNAKINHSANGDETYLVTPAMDLSNATSGTVNCWFVNRSWAGDTDGFGVYYRVNGGAWNQLYYTTTAHSTWTEMGEIALTGFAANYQLGFMMYDGYGYGVGLDDIEVNVTTSGGGQGGDTPQGPVFSAGPVIAGLNILPGTYYLVASSTEEDYEVEFGIEELPCPLDLAQVVYPADDADGIQPNSVTLKWQLSPYCTEYRLWFSSTYWPDDEPNNPATILVDWTNNLAEVYTVRNLYNNTNYFWRIDQRTNGGEEVGGCTTYGEVWGFTTKLNIPNLTVTPDRIYEGETVTLSWNHVLDRTYRSYRIYKDGELIHTTPVNEVVTSWIVPASELEYNYPGTYTFNVTAVYDEGESDFSNGVDVTVGGYSATNGINGYVYEQDYTTPIVGATVTITGTDALLGQTQTYTATTNANGYYEVQVYEGTYTSAIATMDGYQDAVPYQNGPEFYVGHNAHHDNMNFMMDEVFFPPVHVCARPVYVPGVQGDTLVQVYWSFPNTAQAFEAQIGENTTTTTYMPYHTLWNNSLSTALYRADELEAAGVTTAPMSSLSWYAVSTPGDAQQGITIWMANVSDQEVSATSPLTAGMTKVYVGGTNPVTGWNEFVFNQGNFAWDGSSNILIVVQRLNGSWTSSTNWGAQSTSFNSMSYDYDDYEVYNAETTAYSMNRSTTRPIIIMRSGRGAQAEMPRSLHHFNIYRTDCYNDGPYTDENTEFLSTAWVPDTSYFDVSWPVAEPGTYKFGVSAVYAGNRVEYPAEERESEIIWHTDCAPCIDKDMQTDVTVNVICNSADSPAGCVVSFTNLNEGEQNNHPQHSITLDDSGFQAIAPFRKGDYLVTVYLPGYELIEQEVSIWGHTDLRYVLTEIIYNVKGLYVSRTGWAMWQPETWEDYPIPSGAGSSIIDFETGDFNQYNFDNTIGSYHWSVVQEGQDGGYCMKSGNAGISNSTSAIEASVNYTSAGTISFDLWSRGEGSSDTYDWDKSRFYIDDVRVMDYGAHSAWETFTHDVAAGQHTFRWEYKKDGSINNAGDCFLVDNINFNIGGRAVAEERHLEGYKVMCTSIDGAPIFNHNTPVDQPFCQLTTVDPWSGQPMLIEGEHYLVKVATIYSTGESPWCEPVEWVYEPCDHWGPVDEVTAGTNNQGNHIEWVFDHGYNPYAPLDPDDPTPTPGEDVTIILTADDVWQDGSGYQMLLDADANAYGGVIPESGALSTNCSGNEAIYAEFEYKIPTNADGNCSTQNMVNNNSVTITIPAGTYDWCITNPTPGDRIWIASAGGTIGGRYDDFEFEAGNTYTFHVYFGGNNDATDLTVTGNGRSNFAPLASGEAKDIDHVAPITTVEFDFGGSFYNQYAEDGITLNFMALNDVYLRSYLLYAITKDQRFELMAEEQYGKFVLVPAYEMSNFMDEFEGFYENARTNFSLMSKGEVTENMATWKSSVEPANYLSITMDLIMSNSRVENDHCITSLPFCTTEVISFEASTGTEYVDEVGWETSCYSSTTAAPRPAWYHMRIREAGPFVIHMEGHNPNYQPGEYGYDDADIDFCLWGPYTEEEMNSGYACTHLNGDKIIDCSWSAQEVEDAYLGYDLSQHNHSGLADNYSGSGTITYHVPEVGEYYILMITNYRSTPCVIDFTKTEGEGETDCEIVNPTNIIGFLITMDGEYLAFAGPDDREFDHVGEYGDHEYCVRPIYPGLAQLPDSNFYFSMGCPVCASTNGEQICDAGDPIYAEVNGTDDQVHIWWGEQPTPPEPTEPFFYDFEDGLQGWTNIDNDGDSYDWWLASELFTDAAGHGNNGSDDFVCSFSYMSQYTFNADNYLVSPQAYAIDNNTSLSFYHDYMDYSYMDYLEVCVATTTGTPTVADFTPIWNNGGNRIGNGQGRADLGFNTRIDAWNLETIDMSAYAGQNVWIAFHHQAYDQYVVFIDDVTIGNRGRSNRNEIVSYNIYRSEDNVDYALIANVPANEDNFYEYFDAPEPGTYYYQVRALYDDGCESEPAISGENPEVNYVVVGVTGIGENSDNVNLFPNPTKGNVTIQAMNMHRITVVSVLGQVVFDTELDQDEYILNMAKFNTGMYMVRVYTDEGVTVKRVTVLH